MLQASLLREILLSNLYLKNGKVEGTRLAFASRAPTLPFQFCDSSKGPSKVI